MADLPKIEIRFDQCVDQDICDSALFTVSGRPMPVEVWTTDAIESILARVLGKTELGAPEREAILRYAGEGLILECLKEHGHIDSPLYLTSDYLFRRPGMERQVLRRAGLLP
ncbi:MAG TPA: hypothetical protein VFO84_01835 [Dehalococcoidia bacterium]|nr:hypothetical protein [Dehalococcoidia bacterium]